MTRRTPEIDRNRVRTLPARRRTSKVKTRDEAKPLPEGSSVSDLLESLPDLLGGADLNSAIDAWAKAWQKDRLVLFGFGAHLIKVGLAPIVVDLMERGAIGGLMMNGAGCVHDLELAMMGRTSEDVGPALDDGSFGMAKETAERLNFAINLGCDEGLGMGAAIGRDIFESNDRYAARSVLATAWRLEIPITVHAAIGTDIHHMHSSADGAAIGGDELPRLRKACVLSRRAPGRRSFERGLRGDPSRSLLEGARSGSEPWPSRRSHNNSEL